MPARVTGIHVLVRKSDPKTWMAGQQGVYARL